MQMRHEIKCEITYSQYLVLHQRLRAVMRSDKHAAGGTYTIRSLYFDNLADAALREKLDGISNREKFRIRFYNEDISLIHLEKKSKMAGLGYKEKVKISAEETVRILQGDYQWMTECTDRPLLVEFYGKLWAKVLQPKVIVDYVREPYVYPVGNVRVTLDYDIRTSLDCGSFLQSLGQRVPIDGNGKYLMEVKWDAFLPDVIRDIVQIEHKDHAFSKYASCRKFG